jgi:peptidoglycan/xylan/chitin deacetylase (PgdA/CDA1 family)
MAYRALRVVPLFAVGTITNVSTSSPVAALTFDDGPDPIFTPRLLEVLQKHRTKATFFMVGKAAERHPDIVREVAVAGHAIGNHSWDHPSFPLITGRERRAQIQACEKVLAPYGAKLFRPPYGDQSLLSRLEASWLGYRVIMYSLTAVDWLDHDADWMKNRVMSRIQNGSIILFHDSLFQYRDSRYADRAPMLNAVDTLLKELDGRFAFVTVPELLSKGRAQMAYWTKITDINILNERSGPYGEPRRYARVQ